MAISQAAIERADGWWRFVTANNDIYSVVSTLAAGTALLLATVPGQEKKH